MFGEMDDDVRQIGGDEVLAELGVHQIARHPADLPARNLPPRPDAGVEVGDRYQ